MDRFLEAAIEEARKGLATGGIPIGSVLVCDEVIIGRGHNQRVQNGSVIHHAEMNCLENAGRLPAATYARCTLYSTLSPVPDVFWGGFALQDSENRGGGEPYLQGAGRACPFPGR